MAKILRGISASDFHLSGGLTKFFPLRADEKQFYEIEKIFKYAMEHNIRHVFIPGDLTDKARIDEQTFILLVSLLIRYSKYLSVYYILGNHDFAHVGKTAIDVLEVFAQTGALKNVHIMREPTMMEIEGIEVGFVPFGYDAAPEKNDGDKARLIFAHVEEAGAMGDYGTKLKSANMIVKRDKQDFVITGHLHTYQYLKSRRVLYNGAPYQKTFGESPNKGFIEFKAGYKDGKLVVQHEFIDNRPEFRLETMQINESADWAKLEHGEHVFYKLQLGEGVVVPKNITREYPNIVYLNGVSYKGRATLEVGEKVGSDKIPKISPLTGLDKALQAFDLSRDERKAAMRMVKAAIKELGITAE